MNIRAMQLNFWYLAISEVLRKPEEFKTRVEAFNEIYRIVRGYAGGRLSDRLINEGADLFNLDNVFAHLEKR